MSLPAARQHGFLFDLPLAALYAILHRAGPRCRELCRALLDLYGPLPRLTPRGLETAFDLLAAVTTDDRHKQLTFLDLSNLMVFITSDDVQAMCQALPNLHTLLLPHYGWAFTPASIAAATAHLPQLTALHVPSLPGGPAGAPPAKWPMEGFRALRELTLPAPWVRPGTTSWPPFTALSKLCVVSRGPAMESIDVSHLASMVAELPALVALDLRPITTLAAVASLRSLTQLTALALSGVPEQGEPTGPVLQHVGALTNLRSLHLALMWILSEEGDDAAPSWLSGLTRLTSLHVDFYNAPGEGRAFDAAASSAARLPALCELRVADRDASGVELSDAAWAPIAAAHSRLRALHLGELALPASMFTVVMPQLTGLTYLHLEFCNPVVIPIPRGSITSFSWLAALTALRELEYVGVCEDTAADDLLPCGLLAGLSNVGTLSLNSCAFVDGPYLQQLCQAMPQLTSLDLSGNENMGDGLSALWHLTNLEVLSLGLMTYSAELLEHARAPSSLRRCNLVVFEYWRDGEQAHASAVLGRQVEVCF